MDHLSFRSAVPLPPVSSGCQDGFAILGYITLITFKKLVFDGIQQEIVLLLGERNGNGHTGIRTIELNGIDDLASYEYATFLGEKLKEMDHSSEKWTMYFLGEQELQLLRALKS